MIIKWRDSYATGVEVMDAEHKQLIDIINDLYLMQRDKTASKEKLKEVYDSLVSYTEDHFKHEERLLKEKEYDGLEEQYQSHAEFITKLKDMENDLTSGNEETIPVVYKFLREWWLGHIVDLDKNYGPHLSNEEE